MIMLCLNKSTFYTKKHFAFKLYIMKTIYIFNLCSAIEYMIYGHVTRNNTASTSPVNTNRINPLSSDS